MHFLTGPQKPRFPSLNSTGSGYKGLQTRKTNPFHEPKGREKRKRGFSFLPPPLILRASVQHQPDAGQCVPKPGLGRGWSLGAKMPRANPSLHPSHPLPPPPRRSWVRKYKSGSDAGRHVQTEAGRSFCRVSATARPTTGAEVSARRGALEKGLFSIQGGWAAVVTKLGEGGGFKEERSLKGRSGRGASPSPSGRRVGWPARSRLLGPTGSW